MGDYWKEAKKQNQKIRNDRLDNRLEFLKTTNWNYEIKANGHIRVFTKVGNYDVWLSTGKWNRVGSSKYKQGWYKFVAKINRIIEVTK